VWSAGSRGARGRCRVERQQVSGALETRAARGTEEAVVPNLGEAAREHVLEEAREERVRGEREASRLVGARVGVAEGDASVGEVFESVIGERDVVDVTREIARGVLAVAARALAEAPAAGARPAAVTA